MFYIDDSWDTDRYFRINVLELAKNKHDFKVLKN